MRTFANFKPTAQDVKPKLLDKKQKSQEKKLKKERDANKRELRATLRISVIVGTFLFCELVNFEYFHLKSFNLFLLTYSPQQFITC